MDKSTIDSIALIKSVARAIALVWRSENKDKGDLEQAGILFEPSARAAIKAMRRPGHIPPEQWCDMIDEFSE